MHRLMVNTLDDCSVPRMIERWSGSGFSARTPVRQPMHVAGLLSQSAFLQRSHKIVHMVEHAQSFI
jgi:hypothetical protein